jgi:hypothetical protein
MNINDFMRKFLPDYKRRHEEYNPARFKSWDVDFIEENFPEALQDFADRICEKQRVHCTSEKCVIDGEYNDLLIKYAEQPKIEEL